MSHLLACMVEVKEMDPRKLVMQDIDTILAALGMLRIVRESYDTEGIPQPRWMADKHRLLKRALKGLREDEMAYRLSKLESEQALMRQQMYPDQRLASIDAEIAALKAALVDTTLPA